MIKISTGDGQSVEVKEFIRSPNKSVYADAKALAREHLNIPAPTQDPEVERLALLIASVMEGERAYFVSSLRTHAVLALTNTIDNTVTQLSA